MQKPRKASWISCHRQESWGLFFIYLKTVLIGGMEGRINWGHVLTPEEGKLTLLHCAAQNWHLQDHFLLPVNLCTEIFMFMAPELEHLCNSSWCVVPVNDGGCFVLFILFSNVKHDVPVKTKETQEMEPRAGGRACDSWVPVQCLSDNALGDWCYTNVLRVIKLFWVRKLCNSLWKRIIFFSQLYLMCCVYS